MQQRPKYTEKKTLCDQPSTKRLHTPVLNYNYLLTMTRNIVKVKENGKDTKVQPTGTEKTHQMIKKTAGVTTVWSTKRRSTCKLHTTI